MIMNDLIIKEDSFIVSGDKIFFTLQGEGQSIGKPAVFLRLKFCNLRCGFCDTPFAVFPDREDFKKEGEQWTLQETADRIKAIWDVKNDKIQKRLVITGGEPMLQYKAIDNLLDLLPDWKFEIETNGTIEYTTYMANREVQFNISPKLNNSGNSLTLRYNKKVLRAFNIIPSSTFKFVVMENKDLEEIQKIINECGLDNNKIILMPEGVTIEAISKHGRDVADLCKEKGWRLVPRLQIFLWGLRRRT